MTIVSRPSVHGSYIDLQQNELRNAVIQVLGADPSTPTDGQIYYNSSTDRFRLYANGSWEDLATMDDVTAGGISVAIVDAKGDLIVGTANDAIDNLTVGADGTVLVAASGQTTGLQWRTLTEADINLSTTDRLVGRDTASGGAAEEISVGGGVEFTGSGGIQRSALTGDVTAAAGSGTTAIAAGVIVDADVNASAAIAATKLSVTATDRLLGRDTAAAGAVEELTVGGGVEFTGSGGIQRSALTGDITATAGSNTTAIAAGVIVNADVNASAGIVVTKLAASATDRLFGRDTASAGAGEEITVGGGIEFTGTGGIQTSALTGDITKAAGATTTAIGAGVIVDADVNASAAIAATKLAFTPAQGVAATNVQAAIEEVVTDLTASITAATEGKAWKDPVRVATTAAGTLASSFENGDSVDGVTLATGDRILIKDQAAGAENGIYTVNASGAPTRSTDMNTNTEANNATVLVEEGTANKGDTYTQTATIATLGTTAMVWAKSGEGNTVYAADGTTLTLTGSTFSVTNAGIGATQLAAAVAGNGLTGGAGTALAVGAGDGISVAADAVSLASSTAGAGLTYTTGVLAVGSGTGISVAADSISLDTAVAVRKYGVDIGNGALTTFTITHNLGTRDVTWSCYDSTTFEEYLPEVAHTTTNTLTATFSGVVPTTNQLRFVVQG